MSYHCSLSRSGRGGTRARNFAAEPVDVVIAGGGLCGLAVAVELLERGIRAHVFEKALMVRKQSGTAIALAANSTTFTALMLLLLCWFDEDPPSTSSIHFLYNTALRLFVPS